MAKLPHLTLLMNLSMSLLVASSMTGCGSGLTEEQLIDPLHLIENYDPTTPRHHPVKLSEVDLGEFVVSIPNPNSIEVYRVQFHAFAVVPRERVSEVAESVEVYSSRMRDTMCSVVKNVDIDKMDDPAMTWLKAEMIPALIRELHSEEVRDIIFSDFLIEFTDPVNG